MITNEIISTLLRPEAFTCSHIESANREEVRNCCRRQKSRARQRTNYRSNMFNVFRMDLRDVSQYNHRWNYGQSMAGITDLNKNTAGD
jgi:hypothetical protein